jgi:hypothetical protein
LVWVGVRLTKQKRFGRSTILMPRFNLLFLDHGEVLLENALCSLKLESELVPQEGRLYVCSKSVFFEPRPEQKPITRFPYRSMGCEPKFSSNSIVFRVKKSIEIQTAKPYVATLFSAAISLTCELKHTKASKLCGLMEALFAAEFAKKREDGEGTFCD